MHNIFYLVICLVAVFIQFFRRKKFCLFDFVKCVPNFVENVSF